MTIKHYTEEFKSDAVALTEQDYTIMNAARQLDVHHTSLRAWIKQTTQQDTGEQLELSEREELKRLRKENRELKMEKEILKKASAFFAREMK